jgi:hypothetical protein
MYRDDIADNQRTLLKILKETYCYYYYYYQATCLLDQRTLSAVVHLVVESASVAQIVAGAVATP